MAAIVIGDNLPRVVLDIGSFDRRGWQIWPPIFALEWPRPEAIDDADARIAADILKHATFHVRED